MNPLKDELSLAFDLSISKIRAVGGGDIAAAYRLETEHGPRFAKILNEALAMEMFAREADGLRALRQSGPLAVPEVIGVRKLKSGGCLLMEYIPEGSGSSEAHESLGRGLARMHLKKGHAFGWETDNYIGRLPQRNSPAAQWSEFYTRSRLLPQFRMAQDRGLLEASEVPSGEQIHDRLSGLLPEVHPSLLHGDLWSGNYIISGRGEPYLIDPAVYYGHAEVDLAMSRLFGGFSDAFYRAYGEVLPAQPGWEQRNELYQLYYLLVHLNLFGASYKASVRRICRRYF